MQIKIQIRLFITLCLLQIKLLVGLRFIECRTALQRFLSFVKFQVLQFLNSSKYVFHMVCHHIRFTTWLLAATSQRKLTLRKALKVRWNHLRSTHRDVTAFLEIDHTYSLYS